MNESNINLEESKKTKTTKRSARISKISLWMGILAVFPDLCTILFYWWHDLWLQGYPVGMFPDILSFPILFGAICGFPFGLAGIITGNIGLTSQPKIKRNTTFAIIGILFSIFGFIGHIWFFATCQLCQ